jgi:chromosome segregation ATPase
MADEEFQKQVLTQLNKLELDTVDIKQVLEKFESQLNKLELDAADIKQVLERPDKKLETLDSRLYDLAFRSMQANSSAFFGVGIALLSAAIAFVVARVSGGH